MSSDLLFEIGGSWKITLGLNELVFHPFILFASLGVGPLRRSNCQIFVL